MKRAGTRWNKCGLFGLEGGWEQYWLQWFSVGGEGGTLVRGISVSRLLLICTIFFTSVYLRTQLKGSRNYNSWCSLSEAITSQNVNVRIFSIDIIVSRDAPIPFSTSFPSTSTFIWVLVDQVPTWVLNNAMTVWRASEPSVSVQIQTLTFKKMLLGQRVLGKWGACHRHGYGQQQIATSE